MEQKEKKEMKTPIEWLRENYPEIIFDWNVRKLKEYSDYCLQWQAEQQTIDWEMLSIKLLDICIHNELPNPVIIRDKLLYAMEQSLLPLPFKPWQADLDKKNEAIEFADWIGNNSHIYKYVTRILSGSGARSNVWVNQIDYSVIDSAELYELFLTDLKLKK